MTSGDGKEPKQLIEPAIKELARAPNFAALTTLFPNGAPQTQVMWVDCDDDHILINTEAGRQKLSNVESDPRVSVMIWDRENPYRYAEIRGIVDELVRGEEARRHIDELSIKYTGQPFPQERIATERVMLRILPHRQIARG